MRVCVTGAGGFIGGHLTKKLIEDGHTVRAVDIKPVQEWLQRFDGSENIRMDLRDPLSCRVAASKQDYIFNLACSMGGIGFIETHKAECMLNVLINTNLLIAARNLGVKKYFFSSSACVYPYIHQCGDIGKPLEEDMAYPADPEDGYGWEKLFSERMCRHFTEDYGLETVVARFHNCYGTHCTWKGGREKAPAAICRKIVESMLNRTYEIEIWGDGKQTRSFMWIDDCIKGIQLLMEYGSAVPVNLGSTELISIDQLALMVALDIAGVHIKIKHNPDAPKGVNGRNSDNSLLKQLVAWEPDTGLRYGMSMLYDWVYSEMTK